MTTKPKLNKVDNIISLMMLAYPSLFPTRFSAMKHIFCCNGNGYEWIDGAPKDPFNGNSNILTINMESVNELLETHRKKSIDNTFKDMDSFYRLRVIKAKKKIQEYRWREKHIDYLCTDDSVELNRLAYFLLNFHGVYGWLCTPKGYEKYDHQPVMIDPNEMDSEWRNALYRFISSIMQGFSQGIVYHDRKTFEPKITKAYKDTPLHELYNMFAHLLNILSTNKDFVHKTI